MRVVEDPALRPWDVADVRLADEASFEEKALVLLRFAVLAPSGHNTQPWRFAIRDGSVDFYADRSRRLQVVDPYDRALVISVGAAVETFSVAARHFGYEAVVAGFPNGDQRDLVASVRLERGVPGDDDLFAAIPTRRTTRAAFDERGLPSELLEAVEIEARMQGVETAVITGSGRAAIAEQVERGDLAQMGDVAFRRELAAWMRANRSDHRDGMRGYGFGFSDFMSRAGPFVIRAFDMGRRQGAKDRRLAERAAALLVLATMSDTPPQWLATGRALMRVLLRLTASGATASFLNQPIEIAELRGELATTVGLTGIPQLLLRCGYGPRATEQPRRAVEEVLGEQVGSRR